MTESVLQTKVIALLRDRGAFVENRSPGSFGSSGVWDLTGSYRCLPFAVELKRPGTYTDVWEQGLSVPQKIWGAKFVQGGGAALATDDLEVVELFLDELDKYADDLLKAVVTAGSIARERQVFAREPVPMGRRKSG